MLQRRSFLIAAGSFLIAMEAHADDPELHAALHELAEARDALIQVDDDGRAGPKRRAHRAVKVAIRCLANVVPRRASCDAASERKKNLRDSLAHLRAAKTHLEKATDHRKARDAALAETNKAIALVEQALT
jgi:hypothetical protein